MTAAQADLARARPASLREFPELPEDLTLDVPRVEDGAAIWRIARDSGTLDLNSSYSYLLWCRDFAATSAVARRTGDGEPAGFITGYVRPARPRTLVVWQVAVDRPHRGRGLAAALLEGLVARVARESETGIDGIETTVTPGNTASNRLFASFAERHGAPVEREVLFHGGLFPETGHDPEVLHRIGPLTH
ncbi:diaminobutyrate acetyltransferase [Streptomyces roseifaciens]|uniref:diaminobutyrate acetyltransferase n=1 Tax=Streptomyces roseifaciens TaxID=1488406 RepID=UPI00099FFBCE|nr:diaminobutyrate acetyltransferase [Streptomyces roseifaciens]